MKDSFNGKIYLHVGFHKTGTTSLQVHVFPKLENIQYLGRFHKQSKYGEELYLNILKFCCSTELNVGLRDLIITDLNVLLKNKDILLSDEWLTSNYDGFFYGEGAKWTEKQKRLSDLLKSFNTRVLLCTRKPVDAAYSMYCEFKQIPYGLKYESFNDFCENSSDVLIYISGREYLLDLWGQERVTCIEYEQLKDNPKEFQNSLRDYFEGRVIQQVQRENYKNKNEGFIEIRKKGGGFYTVKHLIRNSKILSKLLLDNKFGKIVVKLAIRVFDKKVIIQRLTQKQKKECLDVLKSRKITL